MKKDVVYARNGQPPPPKLGQNLSKAVIQPWAIFSGTKQIKEECTQLPTSLYRPLDFNSFAPQPSRKCI